MKVFRIIWWCLMPVMLFMGLYTGLVVYYIILFTQLLLVLLILAADALMARSYTVKQTVDDEELTKGGETTLHIKLKNHTLLPASLIRLELELVDADADAALEFSPVPQGVDSFHVKVTAPYRGRFYLGVGRMAVTDVFGLLTVPFDIRRWNDYAPAKLTVYPLAETPEGGAAQVRDTKAFSPIFLKSAQSGDSLAGVRRYEPGDSLRLIHWKVSARMGEPMVRQYELPEQNRVLILPDTDLHGLTGSRALIYADTVCECAASLSLAALSLGLGAKLAAATVSGVTECPDQSDFSQQHYWLAVLGFYSFLSGAFTGSLDRLMASAPDARALAVLTREPGPELTSALADAALRLNAVTLVNVSETPFADARFNVINVRPGARACQALGGVYER